MIWCFRERDFLLLQDTCQICVLYYVPTIFVIFLLVLKCFCSNFILSIGRFIVLNKAKNTLLNCWYWKLKCYLMSPSLKSWVLIPKYNLIITLLTKLKSIYYFGLFVCLSLRTLTYINIVKFLSNWYMLLGYTFACSVLKIKSLSFIVCLQVHLNLFHYIMIHTEKIFRYAF